MRKILFTLLLLSLSLPCIAETKAGTQASTKASTQAAVTNKAAAAKAGTDTAVIAKASTKTATDTASTAPAKDAAATKATQAKPKQTPNKVATIPPAVRANIQKALARLGVPPALEITPTPLPNIYQVLLGYNVFYMDTSGEFFISGSFTNLPSGKDLTEERLKRVRQDVFKEIDEEDGYISYGKKDSQHRMIVFTDIECGYCRRFHDNMTEINRLGIRIDYVLTPYRGQLAYRKAMNVWCSKNRAKSLDLAKRGVQLPTANCLAPLDDHMERANVLHVRGTPSVFLDDGTSLGGYLEPAVLKQKALEHYKK